jgi:hypothetical protein
MADVDFLGTLAPPSGGTLPITRGEYIMGVVKVVANAAARDAIATTQLRTKDLCLLADTGVWYQWSGASWGVYTGFGGGAGGAAIAMTFFASTVDGDPTAGGVRLNDATPASATELYIDDVEAEDGTNIRDLLAALGTYVGAQIRLQSKSANQNWIVYKIGGYTGASGYSKLTGLTVVDSSSTVTLSTTAQDLLVSLDFGVPKNLGNQGLTSVRGIAFNGEVATTGASPAVDFTTGDFQKTTLNAATVTPTFTAPAGVCWVQWHVKQDATGGRAITFPVSVLGSPPQPSQTANADTIYAFFWDGTNYLFQKPQHNDLGGLTTGDPHTQYFLADASRSLTGSTVQWGSAVTTPTIKQADVATASATGAAMTVAAQNASGADGTGAALTVRAGDATGGSGTRTGGALLMRSGSGPTEDGDASIQRGTTTTVFNAAPLVTHMNVKTGGTVDLKINGTTRLQVGNAYVALTNNDLRFDASVMTPTVRQNCPGTTAVTGGALTVRAGDATGGSGTRNGGNLVLRPGNGATAQGVGDLQTGGGTSRLKWDATGLSFFAGTTAAKQSVTGSRGGNAALASLLTALATYGLLTDSSSV